MQFSEALTHLMESNGVTAYRLFKDTGIAQSIIGRWKAGKASPSAEYLQEVANYFNVSTDYLLGCEKESPADELDEAKKG